MSKPPKKQNQKCRITAFISPEDHKKLQDICKSENTPVSTIINKALKRQLFEDDADENMLKRIHLLLKHNLEILNKIDEELQRNVGYGCINQLQEVSKWFAEIRYVWGEKYGDC